MTKGAYGCTSHQQYAEAKTNYRKYKNRINVTFYPFWELIMLSSLYAVRFIPCDQFLSLLFQNVEHGWVK
ncbi:hypothetical protein TS65_00975 [Aneurinibacillus migulanus]|uniref:Uncharacterized protein n=1 Tax=Aneurinibacillus migulanus TaxID=47500 RepID=A0A0D1YNH6_ANEMI|nr:hypothetical protein TS65_00975 [Aneurinibacillus migulanus]KON97252.1 hypothetical protein AF333_19055 [Aneurinibacillus migulanus]